jgi:chromosome partitioning protein
MSSGFSDRLWAMRRIALINQKGGVGKTTTAANLGAALAREGQRVVLIDLDPQANLSLHLGCQLAAGEPSTYGILLGNESVAAALRETATPNLSLVAANIDLSGAELELASALGRETLLRDALDAWERAPGDAAPADFVLIDCPPSLGLLSVNGLVAAREALVTVQTEFFALQGMSKLVEVVALLKKRLNPALEIAGILPCLYDSRLKLAREVLAEIRNYFPGKVCAQAIGKNVKLAEAPSYGQTIFEYAPESSGAADYHRLALEVLERAEAAGPPAGRQTPDSNPPLLPRVGPLAERERSEHVTQPSASEARDTARERTEHVTQPSASEARDTARERTEHVTQPSASEAR